MLWLSPWTSATLYSGTKFSIIGTDTKEGAAKPKGFQCLIYCLNVEFFLVSLDENIKCGKVIAIPW